MKLYLDDLRYHPEGWTRAYNATQAKEYLSTEDIVFASLDHDLEGWAMTSSFDSEENGYHVVQFMVENNIWPVDGVRIHTDNQWGRHNMMELIETYSPYTQRFTGRSRTGWKHDVYPSEGDIVIYKP